MMRTLMRWLKVTWRSVLDFRADGGLLLSGALSYFMIMSLVPLVILLISLSAMMLGENSPVLKFIAERMLGLLPEVTADIKGELKPLMTLRGMAPAALMFCALLSYQYYSALNHAFESIFKTERKRTLIHHVVLPVLVVTVLIGLIMASFFLSSALVPMLKSLKGTVPSSVLRPAQSFIIRGAVPFVVILLMLGLFYKVLPRCPVKWKDALGGAVFTAVMLEAAKHFFSWYVKHIIDLGTVYGSLAALITFLLWVFYSSAILIVGAEVVKNLGQGGGK